VSVAETFDEVSDNRSLPDGWRRVKLREVVADAQGGFASGARDPHGVIQLRMNNVTNRGNFDWSSFIRVPADAETIEAYSLKQGDVLFNNTNSTELVGKSALFESYPEPVVFSNHFTRLRAVEEKLSSSFLALWLQAQWQKRVFENICNRWIGQSAVQKDKLLSLEIPLPPLSEQKRIAAILTKRIEAIEQARTATEEQLKAAKLLPFAHLRNVFESDAAKRWPRKRVGEISTLIIDGPHVTPKYVPSGVPFLTVRNIVSRKIDLSDVSYVSPEDHAAFIKRGKAEQGDILYTKDGTMGIPCVVDTDMEFSFFVSVALIKIQKDIANPHYVAFALESPDALKQVENLGAGAGLKHMVLKSIRALEIPLPTMEEQSRIATILKGKLAVVRQLKKELSEQLASINKLSSSLLRQAFNGEL